MLSASLRQVGSLLHFVMLSYGISPLRTGSGKTGAYLIPILSKLMGKAKKWAAKRPNPRTFRPGLDDVKAEPLVLIIVPTRELAVQIFNEARKFCYRTMLRPGVVYGGAHIREQMDSLARGCDVLVGTPGRLKDFVLRPNTLTLRRLKYTVIDEADEMLGDDWKDELELVLGGGGKLSKPHSQFPPQFAKLPTRAGRGQREVLPLFGHIPQSSSRVGDRIPRRILRSLPRRSRWKHH